MGARLPAHPDYFPEILQALEAREALGTTGFGKGIAIPHCRLKSAPDFVVGAVTVPAKVDFAALDGEQVNLIVFIIAPERETNEHIRLLSAISQTLLMPGAVEEMLAMGTSESLRESFLRHTRPELDTKREAKKGLFHVFVQDEDVFRDLIQVLAGVGADSLVVVNAEHEGAYLAKIPLFADFLRDAPGRFMKIIVAVVDKELTNETLRSIEVVTGHLQERTGVMVTVHEVAYAAGSLRPRD
jgi:PTS system nitrogen regulatory IIA component